MSTLIDNTKTVYTLSNSEPIFVNTYSYINGVTFPRMCEITRKEPEQIKGKQNSFFDKILKGVREKLELNFQVRPINSDLELRAIYGSENIIIELKQGDDCYFGAKDDNGIYSGMALNYLPSSIHHPSGSLGVSSYNTLGSHWCFNMSASKINEVKDELGETDIETLKESLQKDAFNSLQPAQTMQFSNNGQTLNNLNGEEFSSHEQILNDSQEDSESEQIFLMELISKKSQTEQNFESQQGSILAQNLNNSVPEDIQ